MMLDGGHIAINPVSPKVVGQLNNHDHQIIQLTMVVPLQLQLEQNSTEIEAQEIGEEEFE